MLESGGEQCERENALRKIVVVVGGLRLLAFWWVVSNGEPADTTASGNTSMSFGIWLQLALIEAGTLEVEEDTVVRVASHLTPV